MIIRSATVSDIPGIQRVRNSVRENKLSHPSVITDEACADYITRRGAGWVCEKDNRIVGFAVADVEGNNIWALFVLPESERSGVGRALHEVMMDWYFTQTNSTAWLSTDSSTRAESFYIRAGWKRTGMHGCEIRFELSYDDWMKAKAAIS